MCVAHMNDEEGTSAMMARDFIALIAYTMFCAEIAFEAPKNCRRKTIVNMIIIS